MALINYLNYHKIDVVLLQEHNIREANVLCKKLNELYHIVINLSIAHNGGTAILVDKRLDCTIRNYEMSADSRIISLNLDCYGKPLYIVKRTIFTHLGRENRPYIEKYLD